MSRDRMLRKLRDSNYELEILALFSHELTHVLGGTEIEAVGVQREVIASGVYATIHGASGQVRRVQFRLNNLVSSLDRQIRSGIWVSETRAEIFANELMSITDPAKYYSLLKIER